MQNLLHKGENILFFDLETVGFPQRGKPIDIIEIGMQYVPNLGYSKEVETLAQLYSIEGKIPFEITKITGIKNSMLENKPHIREHLDLIKDVVNRATVVVAHNAPFDIRCLEALGVDFAGKRVFDTSTHSKRMFPELESHSMGAMCKFLGIENNGAHRAIQDVNAMIRLYAEIADLNKHKDKIETLIQKHKTLEYIKKPAIQ